jgi:hypothetical protein
MTNHKEVSSSKRTWKVLAVVALALIVVAVAAYRGGGQPSGATDSTGKQSHGGAVPPYYADLHGIVLPKTLPPERFREDKTRYAYEVAAKIPETLAQLPCYCPCDRTVGHKSLLHCYADQHAAYCGICQDSALWAEKRLKENASIATIRQEIGGKYSETR